MSSTITGSEPIIYLPYEDESFIVDIQRLVSKDLSEPYSIFTYRYFLHNWPDQCICGFVDTVDEAGLPKREMIATVVCKSEGPEEDNKQGYIAMLAVDNRFRKRGIGSHLVQQGIDAMIRAGCKEIVLEAEVRLTYRPTHL